METCLLPGPGHLPKKAAAIAEKHGATLVNYTDQGCSCGYGCASDCRAKRRHWFAAPNMGAPFDARRASQIDRDLRAAKIAA